MTATTEQYTAAFNAFLDSGDYRGLILTATRVGWCGGELWLELFPEGEYRECYQRPDNRYKAESLFICVPALGDDEYNEEDEGESEFYYALEAIQSNFDFVLDQRRQFMD